MRNLLREAVRHFSATPVRYARRPAPVKEGLPGRKCSR